MVKVLRNNWKSIVTTLLCLNVYVDADQSNDKNVWKLLRRFLDEAAFPLSSVIKDTNISQIIDDGFRRARMKHTTLEYSSSPQQSNKVHTNQKPKDDQPIIKHRFIVEFENEANVSNHLNKDKSHHEKKPPKFRGTEDRMHPRVEENDNVHSDNKPKTHSKSKTQLREKYQSEAMKNRTEGNAEKKEKLAVRTGRIYGESEEIALEKYRNQRTSKLRITKMPSAYQLADDEDKDAHTQPKNNDRLNPYAIDQQMQRYIDCYKDDMNITMEVIGRTAEYNNIVLLKITEIQKKSDKNFRALFEHKYADEAPEKKIIFIVHGLAVMGMSGLIHDESIFRTLMSYYTAHLSKFDIFIIPVANPDGFTVILNAEIPKFWNKNKSPQSSCSGVALDRNFDVEWNATHGISPCSHMYPGPEPFSEPETRAVRDVLHLYSQKIVAYIHVHASTFDSTIFKGDAVLYPKGYTGLQSDDDKYLDIKGDIEESMKNASFRVISVAVEPLYYWYGKVVGTSVDYAATVFGIPYAMEFSMQVYEYFEKEALLQIWRRIIDVIFVDIAKNVNNND